MEGLAIKDTLKEMIRTILDDQPGQVPLGNVVMTWDGHTLSWDVPVRECGVFPRLVKKLIQPRGI
jgi:hypothetical protein